MYFRQAFSALMRNPLLYIHRPSHGYRPRSIERVTLNLRYVCRTNAELCNLKDRSCKKDPLSFWVSVYASLTTKKK
jgi:hypothetical protein